MKRKRDNQIIRGSATMKEKPKCKNCGHELVIKYVRVSCMQTKKEFKHHGGNYCNAHWSATNPNKALLGNCLCSNAEPQKSDLPVGTESTEKKA